MVKLKTSQKAVEASASRATRTKKTTPLKVSKASQIKATKVTKKRKLARKRAVKKVKEKSLHAELISRMLTLATSGLGLVAALAWNETIQGFVKEFIVPRIPGSGLLSQFLYAVIITAFAVLVTYQLSKLASRFEQKAG